MSRTACRVVGLTCLRRDVPVLEDVDLEVVRGQVLALVGPNGAGKSTLLAALSGDFPAASGSIELDGRPVGAWSHRELSRRRAVLRQSNDVAFAFTVREVVAMGRSPWWDVEDGEEHKAAVADALRRADVQHLGDRPFPALSGGERARTSLARVLAQDTPLVLLDEPTAALDLRHTEDVMATARDLASRGRAVVVVLHDLSLAAAWADRVAVLDRGRMVAHGAPAEVLTAELVRSTYGVEVDILRSPSDRIVVVPRAVPHAALDS